MKVNNIDDLVNLNLIIETQEYDRTFHNKYILYAVNIFLDKEKNKYKNTKPIPCVIKIGGRYIEDNNHYCLITTEHDIWSEHFKYNYLDRIDEILLNANDSKPYKWPYLAIYTTKKEAYEHIDKYRLKYDIEKYKEKLSRINSDIEILLKEKQRLEKLIINYENNFR